MSPGKNIVLYISNILMWYCEMGLQTCALVPESCPDHCDIITHPNVRTSGICKHVYIIT